MKRCLLALVLWAAHAASAQTTAPSDLDTRLAAIDARAALVKDLSADFQQSKFTPMLRKPLVSWGRVRVHGSVMRWDTDKPAPTVMLITPQELRLYYPQQATLEIYAISGRLGELAASPLPRLAALREHFAFAALPLSEMDAPNDGRDYQAVRLTPLAAALREHLSEVRVLLDAHAGYIVKAQMIDADGDRTLIVFSGVKTNTNVEDLDLVVPKETRVSRPLAGLESSAPATSPAP